MTEVTIRRGRAEPVEASDCARLMNVAAAGGLARLHGSRWRDLLAYLYLQDDTTLSHRRGLVVVAGSRIVGSLLCFSHEEQVAHGAATRDRTLAFLGWRSARLRALEFVRRLRGIRFGDARPGEMHLFSFALEPDWRRCGLGTRLIDAAESAARDRRCTRLSMDVARRNAASRAFAASLGFSSDPRWCSSGGVVLRLTKELR